MLGCPRATVNASIYHAVDGTGGQLATEFFIRIARELVDKIRALAEADREVLAPLEAAVAEAAQAEGAPILRNPI